MKMTIDMSEVSKCSVNQCAYNLNSRCHAKAITVGDQIRPECDTFFTAASHSRDVNYKAGVGACKVSGCLFNKDYECSAGAIEVGKNSNEVRCLTYKHA